MALTAWLKVSHSLVRPSGSTLVTWGFSILKPMYTVVLLFTALPNLGTDRVNISCRSPVRLSGTSVRRVKAWANFVCLACISAARSAWRQAMTLPPDIWVMDSSWSGAAVQMKVYIAMFKLLWSVPSVPPSRARLVMIWAASVQTNATLRGAKDWYSVWMSAASMVTVPVRSMAPSLWPMVRSVLKISALSLVAGRAHCAPPASV